MEFNNLKRQQTLIKKDIDNKISRVLKHGKYIMGPEVEILEDKLRRFVNVKYCLTTSSGTDALLISLLSLGIGSGDEVITSPFTWVSTVEVIVLLGAKPVFVDIEPDTCNIDANKIEPHITKNTKAIIPVSLFGQTCDMDEINRLANKYKNISVIEDGAQSFGASYKGKKSSALSLIGCTSFFPSKPLGCYGDGGAIFTNNKKIYDLCKSIRLHGKSNTAYDFDHIGICGRMDTIQCAIVLSKLKIFNKEIKRRQLLAKNYDLMMHELGIKYVKIKPNRKSVYAQYSIFHDDRKKVINKFKSAGIPVGIYYPIPINQQKAYKKYGNQLTPISRRLSNNILSLPMSAYLSEKEQIKVYKALKETI